MGIAINIKMSALLLVPGYFLTIVVDTKHGGIIKLILSILIIAAMQVLIGIEFIMSNSAAYWSMSYNFSRVFMKVEQVNFQFLT